MSAVTLPEIAVLVAQEMGVSLAKVRQPAGPKIRQTPEQRRFAVARNVILVLALKHTTTTWPELARYFNQASTAGFKYRGVVTVQESRTWITGKLAREVERVEEQIDALHESRTAEAALVEREVSQHERANS
jgi:hypothetical protein